LPGISQIARRIELLDFPRPSAVDRRVPSLVPVNTLGEILVKQDVEVPPLIESRFKLSVNPTGPVLKAISASCGACHVSAAASIVQNIAVTDSAVGQQLLRRISRNN
jgi:hypothetical protein